MAALVIALMMGVSCSGPQENTEEGVAARRAQAEEQLREHPVWHEADPLDTTSPATGPRVSSATLPPSEPAHEETWPPAIDPTLEDAAYEPEDTELAAWAAGDESLPGEDATRATDEENVDLVADLQDRAARAWREFADGFLDGTAPAGADRTGAARQYVRLSLLSTLEDLDEAQLEEAIAVLREGGGTEDELLITLALRHAGRHEEADDLLREIATTVPSESTADTAIDTSPDHVVYHDDQEYDDGLGKVDETEESYASEDEESYTSEYDNGWSDRSDGAHAEEAYAEEDEYSEWETDQEPSEEAYAADDGATDDDPDSDYWPDEDTTTAEDETDVAPTAADEDAVDTIGETARSDDAIPAPATVAEYADTTAGSFSLSSVSFARRIDGPGEFQALDSSEIHPGKQVLVYGEFTGFASKAELDDPSDRATWIRAFSAELRLENEYGESLETLEFLPESLGRQEVTQSGEPVNFWARYRIPETLTSGRYRIVIAGRDLIGGETASSTLEFTLR